jgi:hypothetical protein
VKVPLVIQHLLENPGFPAKRFPKKQDIILLFALNIFELLSNQVNGKMGFVSFTAVGIFSPSTSLTVNL